MDTRRFMDENVLVNIAPQCKKDYRNVINLSSNENHSDILVKLQKDFLNGYMNEGIIRKYPFFHEVINLYADFIGIANNQVVITPGTDNAIQMLLIALTRNTENIIIIEPNYISYEKYSKINQLNVIKVDAVYEKIREAVNEYPNSIVCLTNPNGFDGKMLDYNVVFDIANKCEDNGCIFIIDEAYTEFSDISHIELIKTFNNVLIVKSFSKYLGCAGIRIGCILGDQVLIDYLARWYPTNAVSSMSLSYLKYCIENEDAYEKVTEEIKERRIKLREILDMIGTTVESNANFVVCTFETEEQKERFITILRQSDIVVKDINDSDKFVNSIRMTVPSLSVLEVCKKAVEEYLSVQ